MSVMSVYESDVSSMLERVMSRAPQQAPGSGDQSPTVTERPRERPAADGAPVWHLQAVGGQTRVTSNFGKVPAQLLRVGDVVRTRHRRFVPVKAIREYKLDIEFLEKHPEAMPVLIPRGALSGTAPTQDVVLSPAQAIACTLDMGRSESVRARDVIRGQQVTDTRLGLVAYYQIVLEQADEIDCEGLWVSCGD